MSEVDIKKLTDRLLELQEWMNCWESSLARLAGLTGPQGKALAVIGRLKSPRMKELARRLDLTTGTVTIMVDRLISLGLVAREPTEGDRRGYHVRLTERGQRTYELYRRRQETMARRLLADQPPEVYAAVLALTFEDGGD